MATIRRQFAFLFLLLQLLVSSASAVGPGCFAQGRSLLADLARTPTKWNEAELGRLTALVNSTDGDFQKSIKAMEPTEAFRIAAYLVLTENENLFYTLATWPGGHGDTDVFKKSIQRKSEWLWKYFQTDISTPDRLRILTDPRAFAEPFAESPQAYRDRAEWRYHMSLLLDRVFGLNIAAEEKKVPDEYADGKQRGIESAAGKADWSYSRLSPNSQNTTYADMENFFGKAGLKAGQTVVDLGASYGRLGLYLGARHPDVKFLGYEINPDRVAAGQRLIAKLGFKNASLFEQDLSLATFELPKADIYYLYDPVNAATRDILFRKLSERAAEAKREKRTIKVICREGRGDFLKFMKGQTWLKPGEKIPSVAKVGRVSEDSIIYESE